jgi:hypothetical protein
LQARKVSTGVLPVKKTICVFALVLTVAGSLTACAPSGGRCQPEPLEVSAKTLSAGDTVTISSPKAKCSLHPRSYQISVVSQVNFEKIVDPPISVDVGADGRFSKAIKIPEGATPGDAAVVVKGSVRDECDSQASCAGYAVHFTIV